MMGGICRGRVVKKVLSEVTFNGENLDVGVCSTCIRQSSVWDWNRGSEAEKRHQRGTVRSQRLWVPHKPSKGFGIFAILPT